MASLTNYLRNKIIDWLLRSQSYTPPATVYVALCTTAPTPSSAGTEVSTSGTGYGRTGIATGPTTFASTNAPLDTSTSSSGTSGTTSNNGSVNFGTATIGWGTISHWELYDAPTGGNRLLYGTVVDGVGSPSPRSIAAADPVSFSASALQINWA